MKNKRGIFCITTGLLLIAAALAITGYNTWEDKQAKNASDKVMEQLRVMVAEKTEPPAEPEIPEQQESLPAEIVTEEEIPDYILNPNMDMPTQAVDGYDYIGIIEIPASDIALPVISEWNYPALKIAPCRFEGSVYTDDMIIAAHDYKAHFKRIRDLSGGEKVTFTDAAGNEFRYEVVNIETVSGTDIEGLTSGEWDMTLFTCTSDGASRVVVRCERIDEEFYCEIQ